MMESSSVGYVVGHLTQLLRILLISNCIVMCLADPLEHTEHLKYMSSYKLEQYERDAELYFEKQRLLRYDYKLVETAFTRVEATFPCIYGVVPIGGSSDSAVFDGHKFLCAPHHIHGEPIVYSLGSFKNENFERSLLDLRPDSTIYLYEINGDEGFVPLEQREKRIKYNGVGLGYISPLKSLKQMMNDNNHTYIDILKIDIEGNEYEFLRHEKDILKFVGQFMIEFHLNVPLAPHSNNFVDFIDFIEINDLRLFHQEINIHNPLYCSEYSFVQRKFLEWNRAKYRFKEDKFWRSNNGVVSESYKN